MKEEQLEKGKEIYKKIFDLRKLVGAQERASEDACEINVARQYAHGSRILLFRDPDRMDMIISLAISETKKEIQKLEKELEAI